MPIWGDVRLFGKTLYHVEWKIEGGRVEKSFVFVGRIILNIIVQVGIFLMKMTKNKQSKSRFSVLIVNNGLCSQCILCINGKEINCLTDEMVQKV